MGLETVNNSDAGIKIYPGIKTLYGFEYRTTERLPDGETLDALRWKYRNYDYDSKELDIQDKIAYYKYLFVEYGIILKVVYNKYYLNYQRYLVRLSENKGINLDSLRIKYDNFFGFLYYLLNSQKCLKKIYSDLGDYVIDVLVKMFRVFGNLNENTEKFYNELKDIETKKINSGERVQLFRTDPNYYKFYYADEVTPVGVFQWQIDINRRSVNKTDFIKRFIKYGSFFKMIYKSYYKEFFSKKPKQSNYLEFLIFLLTDKAIFNKLLLDKIISRDKLLLLIQMVGFNDREIEGKINYMLKEREKDENSIFDRISEKGLLSLQLLKEHAAYCGYSENELFSFVATNKLLSFEHKKVLLKILVNSGYVLSFEDYRCVLVEAVLFESDILSSVRNMRVERGCFLELCRLSIRKSLESSWKNRNFYDVFINQEMRKYSITDDVFETRCLAIYILELDFKSEREFLAMFSDVDLNLLISKLRSKQIQAPNLAEELGLLRERWKRNLKRVLEDI